MAERRAYRSQTSAPSRSPGHRGERQGEGEGGGETVAGVVPHPTRWLACSEATQWMATHPDSRLEIAALTTALAVVFACTCTFNVQCSWSFYMYTVRACTRVHVYKSWLCV